METISNYLRQVFAILIAAVAMLSLAAHADVYHYNNMLIGDRANGMGGAYTAVSDDPSGLYYNPAGVAYAGGSSVNGSANAFHYTYTEYKKVLGDKSWARQSMGLVPNFFGIIQPFAGGMVGLSMVVIDSVSDDQDQHFEDFTPAGGLTVDDYYINFNNQDTTYNLGPSFSLKLRDNFSVGLTLYASYRKQQYILNQQIDFIGDAADSAEVEKDFQKWTNTYWQIVEYGVNPVLGIMWSPFERLSLGLGVRKTFLLQTENRVQNTAIETEKGGILITPTAPPLGLMQPTVGESTTRRELPLQINAGAAYFANDRMLVTGDVAWSQGVGNFLPVLNFAFGAEYYVLAQWALRVGLFSNLSNTPKLNATSNKQQLDHVDLYGGSFSISRFTRNSSLSLGVNSSIGTGKAQLLGVGSALQDMQMHTITTFLAASTSF